MIATFNSIGIKGYTLFAEGARQTEKKKLFNYKMKDSKFSSHQTRVVWNISFKWIRMQIHMSIINYKQKNMSYSFGLVENSNFSYSIKAMESFFFFGSSGRIKHAVVQLLVTHRMIFQNITRTLCRVWIQCSLFLQKFQLRSEIYS